MLNSKAFYYSISLFSCAVIHLTSGLPEIYICIMLTYQNFINNMTSKINLRLFLYQQ